MAKIPVPGSGRAFAATFDIFVEDTVLAAPENPSRQVLQIYNTGTNPIVIRIIDIDSPSAFAEFELGPGKLWEPLQMITNAIEVDVPLSGAKFAVVAV